MRLLAEFIMRGRARAAVVAFLGNWLPLVSPAAVGLVVLGRGPWEGLFVLMWAILPNLFVVGKMPLAGNLTIASLAVAWLAAVQLQRTRAWSRTLLLITLASGVIGLLLNAAFTDGELIGQMTETLRQMTGEEPPELGVTQRELLAFVSFLMALATLVSLVVARWWQAMLYNPGGFRAEFHQLRFHIKDSALLVGAVLLCTVMGGEYTAWINLLALPLLVGGIALAHWLVGQRRWGVQTLVVFYAGLFVLMPLFVPMLVVIGFTDSIVNLRSRLSAGEE